MKRRDPDLEALLERGRIIRRLPDVVRARALARARATMTAESAFVPAIGVVAPARDRRLRVALAVSLCVAIGAAGATAALWSGASRGAKPAPVSSPPAVQAAVRLIRSHASPPSSSTVVSQPTSIDEIRRPAAPVNAQESYAAELKLLKRAQAAFAGGDFSGALALIGEHARRFPSGRLAEEREAMRVRSLAGSGRRDEARRAAAAFAHRFPRSVLLPRLEKAVRPAE